jgi:hypothetical protein
MNSQDAIEKPIANNLIVAIPLDLKKNNCFISVKLEKSVLHNIFKVTNTWWKLVGTRENPYSNTEDTSTNQYGSNHSFIALPADNLPISASACSALNLLQREDVNRYLKLILCFVECYHDNPSNKAQHRLIYNKKIGLRALSN